MYALFSQQKLVYQSLLGSAQAELMNVTHQHENLAMRDTGLKSTLASIQEKYSNEKADLYEELANSISDSDYSLLEAFSDLTQAELEHLIDVYNENGTVTKGDYGKEVDEDTLKLIRKGLKMTNHTKSDSTVASDVNVLSKFRKFEWLCEQYNLSSANINLDELDTRKDIEQQLTKLDNQQSVEEARLNKQIDQTAFKETRLDTEKASIETKITDYQKQLEKIEEAEGKGIEASIGKFQGVG